MARASLHAIGVALVVGPGSVQVWNQSVAMYISTARASSSSTCSYGVSARETYFGGSRFLRFSRAPFFNPTTEGKLYRLPSNQVLQRRY